MSLSQYVRKVTARRRAPDAERGQFAAPAHHRHRLRGRLPEYCRLSIASSAERFGELVAADPRRASVTDIAMRWDFSLFGKFAVAYKVRFGESPRDTLGRRR